MIFNELNTLEIVCPAVEDSVTASVVNIRAYLNMNIIISTVIADLYFHPLDGVVTILTCPTRVCLTCLLPASLCQPEMIISTAEALTLQDLTTHVDEEEGGALFFASNDSDILYLQPIITILGYFDLESLIDMEHLLLALPQPIGSPLLPVMG